MHRLVWISIAILDVVGSAAAQTGRVTFERVCGTCHKPDVALSTRRSKAQWQETVNSMVGKGMKAPDEELAVVIDYLSANYGNVVVPATPVAAPTLLTSSSGATRPLPCFPSGALGPAEVIAGRTTWW